MDTAEIPNYTYARAALARKAMEFLYEMLRDRCGITTTGMYDFGIPAVIQAMAAAESQFPTAKMDDGIRELHQRLKLT